MRYALRGGVGSRLMRGGRTAHARVFVSLLSIGACCCGQSVYSYQAQGVLDGSVAGYGGEDCRGGEYDGGDDFWAGAATDEEAGVYCAEESAR